RCGGSPRLTRGMQRLDACLDVGKGSPSVAYDTNIDLEVVKQLYHSGLHSAQLVPHPLLRVNLDGQTPNEPARWGGGGAATPRTAETAARGGFDGRFFAGPTPRTYLAAVTDGRGSGAASVPTTVPRVDVGPRAAVRKTPPSYIAVLTGS
ncbi:unnamed protein product, partial [Sphacelaria rigidula]